MLLLVYKKIYLLKDRYFYILLYNYICVAIIVTRDYFFKGDNAGGSNTLSVNSLRKWCLSVKEKLSSLRVT